MKRSLGVLGATLVFFSGVSVAQHGGNAGMAGGQSGQHGAAGQHGQARIGSGTGMGNRDQQRLRIHATDQQMRQLRDCTQYAERIRTRARNMNRQMKNLVITSEQAKQWREQLRNEVQAMNEMHEQFLASLSEEQKAASQESVQQVEQSRNQLLETADLLDNELIAPELQQDRIREQARDTERVADKLKKEQKELASQFIE